MKKKWFSVLVCVLFFLISYASVTANPENTLNTKEEVAPSEPLRHILLTIDDAPQVATRFLQEGFDVLYDTITDHSFELITNPDEVQRLTLQGYDIQVLAVGRPFRDIQKEQQQAEPTLLPAGYVDYPAIIEQLYLWESAYPTICKVYDLTTCYDLNTTCEGRHLYAIKISDNVALDEDEPNVLIVAAHHAREIVTPVLCNYSIMKLTTQYGIDPVITEAVDTHEIWISPVWNPDGYAYMYNYDNMWRKNRHPYSPGIGVDQNRNYPFGWYSSGSGSTNPTSEEYKGPYPASEEETQTMLVFGNDRHFAKVLDYHSYGREVLYGYLSLLHPFMSFLQSEGQRLSTAIGYGGSTRLASADGENYQWHLAYNGSYANLVETHTTFQPTYASALSEAALVWPGTVWWLQRPISISGHVRDANSGAPLTATITLEGVEFQNGEHYMSEPRYGRYHLFLPPGVYTVNFSAPEHHPQSHQVTVTLTSAEVLEIALDSFNEPPCTPSITGPTTGFADIQYDYTVCATDPDNDPVYYFIDWGDATAPTWIGPYESGTPVTASHAWTKSLTYKTQVKAKDVYGDESPWSEPVYVKITALNKAVILGLITEKNQTGEYITFNAKFLAMFPSAGHLYASGETIMVSKDSIRGFIGERFVLGVFEAVVLSQS